jgi:DNA-binding transcriptional ArsR family regulator
MSHLVRLDSKIDQLAKYLPDLLREISEKDDEQIARIAVAAQRLEKFAFLVRGVCASVLRRRYPHRLSGGRGKRDQSGLGIQAQMAHLAEQIGVDRRTLETDARIKDTFFQTVDETTLALTHTLAREYYVVALAAPEPQAAIKVALEGRSDRHYTLEAFRSYVRDLKRNVRAVVSDSGANAVTALRMSISVEAHHALLELVELKGQSREEVLADAILALHRSLFKRRIANRKHEGHQLTLGI